MRSEWPLEKVQAYTGSICTDDILKSDTVSKFVSYKTMTQFPCTNALSVVLQAE
jgi:hypothetical protein